MKRILLGVVLSLSAAAAHAELQNVQTLANVSVGAAMKRFSVSVSNCASDISHVMLKVANAGLNVGTAGVNYADGTSDSYNVSYTFQAGYESPWVSIDSFKSGGKCVRSVFVTAQSADAKIKSRVTVLGNNGPGLDSETMPQDLTCTSTEEAETQMQDQY